VTRLFLGLIGLKPAGMERRTPPYEGLGIGFPSRCGLQVRTGFFDAQLELPHAADAIGLGLSFGLTTCPLEIAQPTRKRIAFQFGCACLALQLHKPCVIGQRIFNSANRFACPDRGTGRGDRGGSDTVDGGADYRNARIDNRITARSDDQLLIKSEQAHSQQRRADTQLASPPGKQSGSAASAQIRRTWALCGDFGCGGHLRLSIQ
jgi:hypothetical protein